MALRKVDADVYVTEAGQFIVSFRRSGRRAFLLPDEAAQRYVTLNDRFRLLTMTLLVASFAGAALQLFSPMWIAPAAIVPFVCVAWLRRRVSESFPPLTDPGVIAEIAERNEGREPVWFPVVSLVVLGLLEWSRRHPHESSPVELIVALALVLAVAVHIAVDRRAHAAAQDDRPSSAVTR